MRLREKLISNTFYLLLDWVVVSIFSFLFWSLLAKNLSPSEYGVVATSINFVMLLFGFALIGVNVANGKLIAEINRKEGKRSVWAFTRLSFKIVIMPIFILTATLLIFSSQLSEFLKLPYYVFIISVFNLVVMSIFAFLGSILYGLQNLKLCALTQISNAVIKYVLSMILILFGFYYFAPLIAFFLACLFSTFFRFSKNYLKKGKTTYSYNKIFSFAVPALISIICTSLIFNGQYIILTILKSTEVTGLFAVAATITSVIGVLTTIPSQALFPILSELSVDHNTKDKQGYLMGMVLRYIFLFSIPLSLFLIFFSRFAVILFSKPQYLSSTIYFPILVPAAIFYGVGIFLANNLYAIGKPKVYRNVTVAAAIIFLATSLILIKCFSATGLAISYFITMLMITLLSFISMRKFVKIKFFKRDILKIFFSSFVILALIFVIKDLIPNIYVLIPVFVVLILVYLILLCFLRFYRNEDILILEYFAKKIPILSKLLSIIIDFIKKF